MLLDQDLCYRALKSRDSRFDGRLFVGVLTTGIYCRPICPARTPLRKNVRFFVCAAAAEEAGFRACFRCRPETAPGSPVWRGTSSTVSRGLRLIEEGALNEASVDELAQRLGVGSRHLRRLFDEHLGATPIAIAQTRRMHFARKLIDETELSMAEVAYAAGFASIRRFNAVVKKTFLSTPSELRRRVTTLRNEPPARTLTLRLPYRAPLAWDAMLAFLKARAIPGVETVSDGCYQRTIAIGDVVGTIQVEPATGKNELLLEAHMPDTTKLMQVAERVRSLFDLAANPQQIDSTLSQSEMLAREVQRWPGLRVPGAWDGFELAVRAILGQQVTVQGATTLAGRIVQRLGTPLPSGQNAGLTNYFPRPEVLANESLSGIGLTTARIASIRRLAQLVACGELRIDEAADPIRTRQLLLSIPGIGPWTLEYISMRALRDPDAFPASDLGLRKGASPNGDVLTGKQLEMLAHDWRPWRSYAAMYLWKRCATITSKQTKVDPKPHSRTPSPKNVRQAC